VPTVLSSVYFSGFWTTFDGPPCGHHWVNSHQTWTGLLDNWTPHQFTSSCMSPETTKDAVRAKNRLCLCLHLVAPPAFLFRASGAFDATTSSSSSVSIQLPLTMGLYTTSCNVQLLTWFHLFQQRGIDHVVRPNAVSAAQTPASTLQDKQRCLPLVDRLSSVESIDRPTAGGPSSRAGCTRGLRPEARVLLNCS
jgi:hypothetical protein